MSFSPRLNIPGAAFVRLSDWLAALQVIFEAEGYDEVYIGGGSARDILDHLHHRAPLSMRDLDIYLLRGRPAQPEDARRIAASVVHERLARGNPERIREKARANPALPLPARNRYVTGYGVHLDAPGLPILSLGVLHSRDDLMLNGLFDIDAINLRLGIRERLGTDPFEVIDPHGGFASWRARQPRVVHWAEVQRCYTRHSLRIARCFARVGRTRLEPSFVRAHRAHRPAGMALDSLRELHRDFLKLLSGPRWQPALRMLGELDTLGVLFPGLQARLCAPAPLPDPPGETKPARALARARALLSPLPDLQSKMMLAELEAVAGSVFGG